VRTGKEAGAARGRFPPFLCPVNPTGIPVALLRDERRTTGINA
jgi:hypothetical protein